MTMIRIFDHPVRAERRAAPKPASITSGDRLQYSADEGLS